MSQPKIPSATTSHATILHKKVPNLKAHYPDEDFPDEVILRINEEGETIMGNYAISHEIRMAYMDNYKQFDCRRLAFLEHSTTTGGSFAQQMVNIARIRGTMREFKDLSHKDRKCVREIRMGHDGKGAYCYELGRERHHVSQISAPKYQVHGKIHEHEKHVPTSGHHGSHGKYEKAKHGGHGKYK